MQAAPTSALQKPHEQLHLGSQRVSISRSPDTVLQAHLESYKSCDQSGGPQSTVTPRSLYRTVTKGLPHTHLPGPATNPGSGWTETVILKLQERDLWHQRIRQLFRPHD